MVYSQKVKRPATACALFSSKRNHIANMPAHHKVFQAAVLWYPMPGEASDQRKDTWKNKKTSGKWLDNHVPLLLCIQVSEMRAV